MCSEFYFYVAAFIEDDVLKSKIEEMDDISPTIYRIDQIKNFKILEERFHLSSKHRFEEGEFRKKIMCMYGGKSKMIKLQYTGSGYSRRTR